MRRDITITEIANSDATHVEDIVVATVGDFKFAPEVGFQAIKYLKSTINEVTFQRNLKQQLIYDGYNNANININKGIENLTIEI